MLEKEKIQQEFLLKLEYLTDEMTEFAIGDTVTDENITELCVIYIVSNRINNIINSPSEDVPVEIFIPWLTVQTHNELLQLYRSQIKLRDGLYLDTLEKISSNILVRLFDVY